MNPNTDAVVSDLTHDARVAMNDLDMEPDVAAATVMADSDLFDPNKAEVTYSRVVANLEESR